MVRLTIAGLVLWGVLGHQWTSSDLNPGFQEVLGPNNPVNMGTQCHAKSNSKY